MLSVDEFVGLVVDELPLEEELPALCIVHIFDNVSSVITYSASFVVYPDSLLPIVLEAGFLI